MFADVSSLHGDLKHQFVNWVLSRPQERGAVSTNQQGQKSLKYSPEQTHILNLPKNR